MAPEAGYTLAPEAGYTLAPEAGYTLAPEAGYTLVPEAGYTLVPEAGYTARDLIRQLPRNAGQLGPQDSLGTQKKKGHRVAPVSLN
ncbi:MAG: hypothetical protein ACK54I_05270 [Planctomycetota bacterium]